ncbi:MAG: hypothetical protein RL112_2115 [Planctomycetota bacterium]
MRLQLRDMFCYSLLSGIATLGAPVAVGGTSPAQLSLVPEGRLAAALPTIYERFGEVVAMSGDLLAIGAPSEDGLVADFGGSAAGGAAQRTGTVYLYRRAQTAAGEAWALEGRLKSAAPKELASFGASISLHGNLLAVGKPDDPTRAPFAGGCEVWRRTEEHGEVRWSLELDLELPLDESDRAGYSVAISSNALAVGIPFEDSDALPFQNEDGNGSGCVYLLRFQLGLAGEIQPLSSRFLKAPVIQAANQYGRAVALGDGFLAVGVPSEHSGGLSMSDNSLPSSGAVFVHDTLSSTAQLIGYLKASNADAGDLFGYALSAQGSRLAVGAPREDASAQGLSSNPLDNSKQNSGAAYVFRRGPTGFEEERYVKPIDERGNAWFGEALALDGQRLLVGARNTVALPGETDGSVPILPGVAYLFDGVGGVPSDAAAFRAPTPTLLMEFGAAVAMAGDLIVVGAPAADAEGATRCGAAFAFRAIVDCDGDGRDDAEEIAAGESDCDGNARPDNCDVDVNGDGLADACQVGGVANCFGDGHLTACPCGNRGATGRGCANSSNPAGARLDAEGLPSRGFDSLRLVGTGMTPTSAVLYFQATGGSAGTPFGDGLRCTSGSVLRLGATVNVGGASSWPAAGAARISVGGQISGHLGQRTYQAWYRDVNPFFCVAGARFNLTNAVRVNWVP